MSLLSSFIHSAPDSKLVNTLNIAIVGASGGIGQAVSKLLLTDPAVARLYSLSRLPLALGEEAGRYQPISIDITNETSIKQAADTIAASGNTLDMVLITTGVLHDKGAGIMPEKALKQLNADQFMHVMAINTLGPSLVAKHFLPLMAKQGRAFMGLLSARVGSISDNGLGGWHSYRASKAALNMLIKNMAIEYRRKQPQLIISGLHPGTVNTALSKPFQHNVKPEKLFSSEFSARQLLQVINSLSVDDSGDCFAWDGKRIPA